MPTFDDAIRGPYSRAVRTAVERLREDVANRRILFSEHILHVQAGSGEEAEPTWIMIEVRAGHLRAVQAHFLRHPVSLDVPHAAGAPTDGDTADTRFGDADLAIYSRAPDSTTVPPTLDPATMVGRDVDEAERELTAAGWKVRPLADGDAMTLDQEESRANLHYRSDDTAADRTVYATFVG